MSALTLRAVFVDISTVSSSISARTAAQLPKANAYLR